MTAGYLKHYRVAENTYFYFRPSLEAATAGARSMRLDAPDLQEAERQAQALAGAWKALIAANAVSKERSPILNHIRVMLSNARTRARRMGAPMLLGSEDVTAMLVAQGFRCAVSGLPFDLVSKPVGAYYSPWRPSLDRIDRSLGYTVNNVRVVSIIANWAMGEWGEDHLIRLAKAVTRRNTSGRPVATSGPRTV